MMIDHLILGDNPFFGINHRSQTAGKEKLRQFDDVSKIVDLFQVAKNAGARGVMLAAHAKTKDITKKLIQNSDLKSNFSVYPNIPYLMKYVSEVTKNGMVGTATRMLTSDSGASNLLSMMKGGFGLVRKDFHRMIETGIDFEFSIYSNVKTPAIFLHNGIVDLLLGLQMKDVLLFYDDYIRQKYKSIPGFGTLNFAKLSYSLKSWGIQKPLIMAPFNARGYYMNPSRQACEKALLENDGTLLAMNVLAQGALDPKTAFEYLGKFGTIKHVIIGASSKAHIEESFGLAKKYLGV